MLDGISPDHVMATCAVIGTLAAIGAAIFAAIQVKGLREQIQTPLRPVLIHELRSPYQLASGLMEVPVHLKNIGPGPAVGILVVIIPVVDGEIVEASQPSQFRVQSLEAGTEIVQIVNVHAARNSPLVFQLAYYDIFGREFGIRAGDTHPKAPFGTIGKASVLKRILKRVSR